MLSLAALKAPIRHEGSPERQPTGPRRGASLCAEPWLPSLHTSATASNPKPLSSGAVPWSLHDSIPGRGGGLAAAGYVLCAPTPAKQRTAIAILLHLSSSTTTYYDPRMLSTPRGTRRVARVTLASLASPAKMH